MANKAPLAIYNGKPAQMQSGDKVARSFIEGITTVTANIATTYAIDLANSQRAFILTATGDCTLSVTNATTGDIFWLEIISQGHAVTLFSGISWLGTSQAIPGAHSVYMVKALASGYLVTYGGEVA